MLIQLHHINGKYRHLVDIHGLNELNGIMLLPDDTLRIGSGTTFSQIIDSPLVQRHIPILAEAAATIAGPQVRNMATLGGNICNGATSADSASPCVVMEAELEIATPTGLRRTPIQGFHTGPGKVALGQNEVAVALLFRPQHYQHFGASYYKYAMRGAMDIATIGCAAACKIENGHFSAVKIAFGVAAPTPIRAPNAEAAALGQPFNAQRSPPCVRRSYVTCCHVHPGAPAKSSVCKSSVRWQSACWPRRPNVLEVSYHVDQLHHQWPPLSVRGRSPPVADGVIAPARA